MHSSVFSHTFSQLVECAQIFLEYYLAESRNVVLTTWLPRLTFLLQTEHHKLLLYFCYKLSMRTQLIPHIRHTTVQGYSSLEKTFQWHLISLHKKNFGHSELNQDVKFNDVSRREGGGNNSAAVYNCSGGDSIQVYHKPTLYKHHSSNNRLHESYEHSLVLIIPAESKQQG